MSHIELIDRDLDEFELGGTITWPFGSRELWWAEIEYMQLQGGYAELVFNLDCVGRFT